MTRTGPIVQDGTLVLCAGDQRQTVSVGAPAWYAWLATATTFSFIGPHGTFTARKECREHRRWYWRAYRKRFGKLQKVYLGKEEALTLERLNDVATLLAEPGVDPHQVGDDSSEQVLVDVTVDKASVVLPVSEGSPDKSLRDTLLTTKLSRPPLRPDLMARPRLLERLSWGLQRKLTLISAPPGFGKTTLLSQWGAQSAHPIAWVSLEAGDNDPARFWTYVIAALQTLCPHLGDQMLGVMRIPQPPPVESLLTIVINALAAEPEDLILVLDDYHVIDSPAIHSALAFLLDHVPFHVHLVIASRCDPPFPLARLRGTGELTELKAADLSFTPAETRIFLNELMRLDLSGEDVATLGECTEGWIVGLQLAGLSIQGCEDVRSFTEAFAGGHRDVVDYLVEEVLRRQPEEVQTFLLQTSVLDRLSGPLCETVTGQVQGQSMLETLERANLFTVPLDNERHWYRHHQLFAEALRARMRQIHPEHIPELHRRACLWHRTNGLASEAVSHALAAKEFELAAGLIEEAGPESLRRGELTTLMGWLRELPDAVVGDRPKLRFLRAYAPVFAGQLETAEAQLQEVESFLRTRNASVLDALGPAAVEELLSSQHMLNESMSLRAWIVAYRGDVALADTLSRQALEHSVDDATARSFALLSSGEVLWWKGDAAKASDALAEAGAMSQAAGNAFRACGIMTHLAGMYAVQGKLHQAERTYRHAFRLAGERGDQLPQVTATLRGGLGRLLYEWNDLDGAMRHAEEGIELGKQGEMKAAIVVCWGVLARVRQARGNIDEAFDLLLDAEQMARANNYTQHVRRIAAYRARLWLLQGSVEAAVQWAHAARLRVDDELSYIGESDYLTLVRVLLAQGRSAEAVRLLGRLLHAAESAGRTGSVIKVLSLRALALEMEAETEEALSSLARALSLAEPEGYVRTFVDEGRPMATLLLRFLDAHRRKRLQVAHHGSLGHVRTLLAVFGPGGVIDQDHESCDGKPKRPTELLSERELEVLWYIAAGWSAPGIAQELVLSINTVKTHIKRIYGKLDAHSGTEAAAKARDLKLL